MVLLWGYEKNRNTTLVFENNSNEKQKPPFYTLKRGCVKIDTSSFLLSLYLVYHIIRYLLQLCC